jgi:hypothetical protein
MIPEGFMTSFPPAFENIFQCLDFPFHESQATQETASSQGSLWSKKSWAEKDLKLDIFCGNPIRIKLVKIFSRYIIADDHRGM